jgi:HPt (histidine-containing phosphotransfer) domain-containing protein
MEQPSLQYVQQLSGGDKAFEKKLLAVVIHEFPDEKIIYEGNMEKHAFAKAAENVHKLKHKFGILSLEKSYQVAIDYEEQLLKGEMGLRKDFEDILQRIQEFLLTLSLE